VRVAVIGGRGFVGRATVAALGRRGHDALPVGRGDRVPAVDAIIHLALYSEADARAARGLGGRLVVASSGDVYRAYGQLVGLADGPAAPGPLDEEAPLRSQLYPYGRVIEMRGRTYLDYESAGR
jgi:nucleoside-diphosphate-sugar epimerase